MRFLEEIKALFTKSEIGTSAIFGFVVGLFSHAVFGSAGIVVAVLVYLMFKYSDVLLAGLEPKKTDGLSDPSVSI